MRSTRLEPLVRRIGFSSRDWANGSPLRRAVRELQWAHENDWDSEIQSRLRRVRLARLLAHATATVPAYHEFEGASLQEMPVITKDRIKQSRDLFHSNAFRETDLITMRTGGSTGVPFAVLQNREKKLRVSSELIFFTGLLGYRVGDPFVFARAMRADTMKSNWRQWMQGLALVDCKDMSANGVDTLLRSLDHHSGKTSFLMAYASTLDAISSSIVNGKAPKRLPRFAAVISGAEMLREETREVISRAFGCPVVSRYSNQENGVLAQDRGVEDSFVLNHAHYLFEVLDWEKDTPVSPGHQGRLVVTDLHNWAMPLIRYETGDIAAIDCREDGGVRRLALSRLEGRQVDWLTSPAGQRVSPNTIVHLMASFQEVHQYRFVQQVDGTYTMQLRTGATLARENELLRMLSEVLGPDAVLELEYVESLGQLSSGKRQVVANLHAQREAAAPPPGR